MAAYSGDFNSRPPVSQGSDTYMQCKYWAGSTNWGYGSPQPTALGLIVDMNYLNSDKVLACPSRNAENVTNQAFQGRSYFNWSVGLQVGGRKFDYDYRYNQPYQHDLCGSACYGNWGDAGADNLGQPGGYPGGLGWGWSFVNNRDPFTDSSRTNIMFLSDCCEGADRSPNPNPGVWAHVSGGHILTHSGAAKFYPNWPNPSGLSYGYPVNRLSWPSDWIINQARYYELSLDVMTKSR